ncbi:MAG: PIN domain-containing protein [candidate division NC10 bacterium]
MRVYFNTSALNRPLDDLSSERVRLEAEAVVGLLAAVESGRVDDQDPDAERVRRVRSLLGLVSKSVAASRAVAARARDLERVGFRGLDALHMASAEAGGADLLITTDDRMIRRAVRVGRDLLVRLVTPPEAVALVSGRPSR